VQESAATCRQLIILQSHRRPGG